MSSKRAASGFQRLLANKVMNQKMGQDIFDAIPAGIIQLDAELRIAYANPVGQRAIGAQQDCTGRFFGEVARPALVSMVSSALEEGKRFTLWGYPVKIAREGTTENAATQETCEATSENIATPEAIAFWDYTIWPSEDGTVIIFAIDVTDRVKAERGMQDALDLARRETRKLQALLQQMSDGVIVCTAEGRIATVNPAAQEMLAGAPSVLNDEAAPQAETEIRDATGKRLLASELPWRVSLATDLPKIEMELVVDRDGQPATLSAHSVRIHDEKGRLVGSVTVLRDVTESRLLISRLREANRRLEEFNRLKAEFVANMSHELRTPLTAIIGFAQLMQLNSKQRLAPEQQDALERILRNSRHLLNLIDDVLDISKIEAGRIQMHHEHVDLVEVVRNAFGELRLQAQQKGLRYELKLHERFLIAFIDPTRVRQIVLNLLSNAIKFTPRGSVEAELSRWGEHEWRFTVRDTGIGIKEEALGVIFERFRQVDGSTTRATGGAGLGLTIVHQLVQLLGGRIEVSSAYGEGSVFSVTLPLVAPGAEEEMIERTRARSELVLDARAEPSRDGRRPLVLVIEDDADAASLLETTLERAGYAVKVTDGRNAHRLARELSPAAITLDIMMPQVDGWRVLRAIKADPSTSQIPVIVCSIVDNRPLGYRLGASDYLVKPVEPKDLIESLRSVGATVETEEDYVLVVDDEHGIRELLVTALENAGFRARSVASGEAALRVAQQHPPRVILCDLIMPGGMSGFELIARLRVNPQTARTPIIIITGKDITPEDRKLITGQIADVIRKGEILMPDLESRLRETLEELGVTPSHGESVVD